MSTERELQRKRDRMAEEAGEGAWLNPKTGEWCSVDVTFYPSRKVWITEAGKRRETTRKELEADYKQLEV